MEEKTPIILKEHLITRWYERFPEETEKRTSQELEEHIRFIIDKSYPVYTEIKDGDTYQFLYRDFRIILYCETTNSAITVFPTDYNHTADIDRLVAGELYQKIREIDRLIDLERETIDQQLAIIDSDLAIVDENMRQLQRQIDQLKSRRARIWSQREESLRSFDVLVGERNSLGRQLAYSVSYRLENKPMEIQKLDTMIDNSLGRTRNNRNPARK